MDDRPRVPMPKRWIADQDVSVAITPPLVGRRFSIDINEYVLAQVGARALAEAVETLGRHVALEHIADVQHAVDRYLMDYTWVQPILENELRRCVREFVMSLWSDEEKRAQREWFDLFAAKLLGSQQP